MNTQSQGIYYLIHTRTMMVLALALFFISAKASDSTLVKMELEILSFKKEYKNSKAVLEQNMIDFLAKDAKRLSRKEMQKGMSLFMQFKQEEIVYENGLLKIRFEKSISLIRLLYEKLLSIDHHFTSLNTHEHIHSLTNPNAYSSFKLLQGDLDKKQEKKFNFEFPELLKTNTYLTAAYSLISSLFSGGVSKKTENFQKISCILDFTVSMHSELNIIYFETEFLKDANRALKDECALLFTECLKAAGYYKSLESCRESDDWENAAEKIHYYLEKLDTNSLNGKDQVDLKFNIDRVVDFIDKYNDFISQGNKYYGKFEKIIGSYRNKEICVKELPVQFNELLSEIKNTIKKFNTAYNLPELRGSKLKELMYGNIY